MSMAMDAMQAYGELGVHRLVVNLGGQRPEQVDKRLPEIDALVKQPRNVRLETLLSARAVPDGRRGTERPGAEPSVGWWGIISRPIGRGRGLHQGAAGHENPGQDDDDSQSITAVGLSRSPLGSVRFSWQRC